MKIITDLLKGSLITIKKVGEEMDRNLDGVYFRIKRDDKWQNICFSDLSDDEMEEVMQGRSNEWLKSLCKVLGHTLREIGDQLDIVME